MTSEQLQQTRAERWRLSTNPLLTAEDAGEWLTGVGFCLYLPRRAQIAAPAPSFVEAVMGAVTDAPPRETIEQAAALLRRLEADGAAIPLNLLSTAGAVGSSDAPDFLSTPETLPYIFSLIGGRNWKSGPGAKASPLMTNIWTLLNDGGAARTAQEIQSALAGEPSEAAVLRALVELWNGLRVLPVYSEGATRWELTQARFAAEMTASQKIAQTTSLSALVSLYLETAIAASAEEIAAFLSPLSARSRVREVINGLQATRQLGLISIGAQPLLHIAGALPEFDEESTEPAAESETPTESAVGALPGAEKRPDAKPFRHERKPFEHGAGKSFPRTEHKPYPHKERFAAQGREERREPERDGVHKRPFEKKPFERGRGKFRKKSFGPRSGERGEERRPSYANRDERPPREGRGFGGKKQFGEKRPFFRDRDERSEGRKPREFGSGFNSKRREGERPARHEGERPNWHESERPAKREGGWKPRGGFAKGGFAGRGKPGFKRDGERRFPRQQRPDFRREGKPEFRREGGARPDREGRGGFRKPGFGGEHKRFEKPAKPFSKFANSSERPSKPYGKPGKSFGKFAKDPNQGPKPFGRAGKPFGRGKPHFDKPGSGKPAFGKPRFGKPAFGKPGFGKRGSGKPAFGARKPGGFKPPSRKRKPEDHGDAE